ncbi:hypothetical protein P8C59_008145 [Phyllachora maydis]|uniref:Uncharacterized protein n=1 Tax=Phyllachora maydis TaxID=1825666 RepID=A0AAD9IBN0_9PEZI|nr:hypothetical protein P8C59_008145 [Phyllachora maydis]
MIEKKPPVLAQACSWQSDSPMQRFIATPICAQQPNKDPAVIGRSSCVSQRRTVIAPRPSPPSMHMFGIDAGHFIPMGASGTDLMSSMLDTHMLDSYHGLPMMLEDADVGTSQTMDGASGPSLVSSSTALARAHGNNDAMFASDDLGGSATGSAQTPTGSAAGLPPNNTLTEFTKRRNWPAKVVEELQDILYILDANGRIRHVSPSITALTGYKQEEVLESFLRHFIHPDDCGVFMSELNESIASGNRLRLFYRLKKKDGTYAIFESVGHAHIAAAKFAPNPNNQTPFCQAVFMMARPYPTKNAGLLDSFLEHKIENERLRRRIAELRREEEADADESHRVWRQSQEGRSDFTPSEDFAPSVVATPFHQNPSPADGSMGPPERPADKMVRYEASSHAETIEMLTGLRYLEGERSRGITTGNASPTLIKGDAGIAIPTDRDGRAGDTKKKQKLAEEYVCTDCGTLESPEWRKGPSGPKTLCNACGLRWAKKEKKKSSVPRRVYLWISPAQMASSDGMTVEVKLGTSSRTTALQVAPSSAMSGYGRDDQPDYGSGQYQGGGGGDGYGRQGGGGGRDYDQQGGGGGGGYEQQGGSYGQREEGYGGQGGHLPPGNKTHGGAYPAGGGFSHDEDEDFRGAAHHAAQDAGDSGDSGFFGNVLNSLGQRKQQIARQDVDEDDAVRHHQKYFGGQDDGQPATSGGIGSAAAMQALKMFSGGSSGGSQSQSQFIGLAMSQASKLFDQQSSQGNMSSGTSKESAVTQAAEMALKFYMKNQGGGGSGGSGMSGLMGLASKFINRRTASPALSSNNAAVPESAPSNSSCAGGGGTASPEAPRSRPVVEPGGNAEQPSKETVTKRFVSTGMMILRHSKVNWLLLFAPVGIAVKCIPTISPGVVFALNAIAIVPLAGLLSHATESVARRMGDTVGALLNVTFGNAVELIIFMYVYTSIALTKGEIRIVQASLLGSILANLLLILGMSFLLGGLRYREQIYNSTVTQMSACLLSLSVISLVLPPWDKCDSFASLRNVAAAPAGPVPRVRFGIRRTNSLPDRLNHARCSGPTTPAQVPVVPHTTGTLASAKKEVLPDDQLSRVSSILLLLVSTATVAVCAEFMVDSIDGLVATSSIKETFIGLIILPIVGNAAEHVTAVTVAMRNKIDLAIGVAIGSSIQIALFITPIVVILGWIMNQKMTLYFTLFETVCLFVSTFIVNFLVLDGRSNYLEGTLLCATYIIIGTVAFFYPNSSEASVWGVSET